MVTLIRVCAGTCHNVVWTHWPCGVLVRYETQVGLRGRPVGTHGLHGDVNRLPRLVARAA